jgi:transposase
MRKLARDTRKHKFYGVRRLTREQAYPWSSTTTWRRLREMKFRRRKLARRPLLSASHIAARKEFALKHLHSYTDWDKVVFSDEKRFKYDGPDGYKCYWHQLGTEAPEVAYSTDYNQYRGVMVWACISSEGVLDVERIRGPITSESYTSMIFERAIWQIHRRHGTEFIFQQDNASPHRAAATVDAFQEAGMELLTWPALSPDLNAVENLWSILVRKVYADGRAYHTDDELWGGIEAAARSVTVEEVQRLIRSMPSRLTTLLQHGGKYAQ